MTHKDIYTKFMIEYDKANVTSSYPSLTEYEVATVLDKAYNALIAQKVTGNNVRRVPLEADLKAISDITPLITEFGSTAFTKVDNSNVISVRLPNKFLYFINAYYLWEPDSIPYDNDTQFNPLDKIKSRKVFSKIVGHDVASKFIASSSNIPWVKESVCYIEDDSLYIIYDYAKVPKNNGSITITYIKKPNTFVKNLDLGDSNWVSFFDWGEGTVPDIYKFECNDTVAEELISLAVTFALETVESQRLNSKLNMRGLEA